MINTTKNNELRVKRFPKRLYRHRGKVKIGERSTEVVVFSGVNITTPTLRCTRF